MMPAEPALPRTSQRLRRVLPWVLLVGLLAVAQTALVRLTLDYESAREQELVEQTATVAASDIKQSLGRDLQSLQALLWNEPPREQWLRDAAELLRARREMVRIERRDLEMAIESDVDTPYRPPLFTQLRREAIDIDAEVACATATRLSGPAYSRSYFLPLPGGLGVELLDVCLPVLERGRLAGYMVASYALQGLLTEAVNQEIGQRHELAFVEGDGTRLARAGSIARGRGVFVSQRLIDLPGMALQLRLDSGAGEPDLIPNLATALVLGLSLALSAVVLLLVRDVRKRAAAEHGLAEALAFRKAMEDSLVTGLRARDLEGRITYVNPAFCEMVGFAAAELIGKMTVHNPPPYWPPELVDEYSRRQQVRLAGSLPPREGYETVFMRRNGERFPVMVYEAPLVDGQGRHTGWMSAVLDLSAQRRAEELSRQQHEKLQATARLATVGEMASLLSHELNQPLAAISSYATGSINLMHAGEVDAATQRAIRGAIERIAEQAERAGRVIKSVHDFVRRREHLREAIRVDQLIDAVMPLVKLQARKSATRIEIDLPMPPLPMPRVVCDRTMVEQVLLNLTRNGIQAMEAVAPEHRVLRLQVRQTQTRWVEFAVVDQGPGIADEVAERLFTPFFTTKSEGMGLGLSLCRTVVEQHGGLLVFSNRTPEHGGGTEFRFTLASEPGSAASRRAVPGPPARQAQDADLH
ncbi:two-component system sensor histidine kinase NtrB [Caldimonas brevitalea]|uniref:histidine kinase n=1 Tax=Caldimonas brevitalea TaxID=413882 RepID=A0A0G3BG68_9BURK|nr:ATP-binding protein [Caldimonas brevitalea]AKJ26963.1 histidine kinase [Caldimonas brevitalea]